MKHIRTFVMAFIGWTAFQLVTALAVFAVGVVLGHVWEARMKTRSKNRIRRWDLHSK